MAKKLDGITLMEVHKTAREYGIDDPKDDSSSDIVTDSGAVKINFVSEDTVRVRKVGQVLKGG